MNARTTKHKRTTKKKKPATSTNGDGKKKMKLVGYFEERETAEAVARRLKERGTDTSAFLREAYRSVLLDNQEGRVEWRISEHELARRLSVNKDTLGRRRRAGELHDEQGDIWHSDGTHENARIMYDVDRARRFFMPDDTGAQTTEGV